jgi:hypothetical protein
LVAVYVEGYEVADGCDAESMKKERRGKRDGGKRNGGQAGFLIYSQLMHLTRIPDARWMEHHRLSETSRAAKLSAAKRACETALFTIFLSTEILIQNSGLVTI